MVAAIRGGCVGAPRSLVDTGRFGPPTWSWQQAGGFSHSSLDHESRHGGLGVMRPKHSSRSGRGAAGFAVTRRRMVHAERLDEEVSRRGIGVMSALP
jgi:hypothetical protein